MKKIATLLCAIIISTLSLAAQDIVQQDTIATFEVEGNDNVVLSSKEDGISIDIAGYKIALAGAKNRSEDEQQRELSISTSGATLSKVSLEEDGVTVKKRKRCYLSIASNSKLGVIALSTPDYSIYSADNQNFMDLRSSKSIYFGLDVVSLKLPLNDKGNLSLKTGLNLMCYNYTFADDITLTYQNNIITPVAIESSNKKSKLATTYLAIPLSLSIDLGKKFTLEPGLYAGVLINSHTKYKKPKVKSDYLRGVNDAVAGASLTLSHDGFGIYCDYNFTSLFEQDRGPECNALTVGIKFNL